MYDLDSTDHYYTVVRTIANAARRNDPSSPKHVATSVIATTQVVGDELATLHSAQPYAMDRLKPSDVLIWSDVGTSDRPLTESEQDDLQGMSLRDRAVFVLATDLRERDGYTGE
jgi:hypothetical protein